MKHDTTIVEHVEQHILTHVKKPLAKQKRDMIFIAIGNEINVVKHNSKFMYLK